MSWDQAFHQAIIDGLEPAAAYILEQWFPCSRLLAGNALASAADEYRRTSPPAEDTPCARAARWEDCLAGIVGCTPTVEPFASDVVAYEGIAARMALDVAVANAARRSAASNADGMPLSQDTARCFVPASGPHARLARFSHNVPAIVTAIESCDRLGDLHRPAECMVLFVLQPQQLRPDVMLVSSDFEWLLGMCDGQRDAASIIDQLRLLTGNRGAELADRTLGALEALRRRNAICYGAKNLIVTAP